MTSDMTGLAIKSGLTVILAVLCPAVMAQQKHSDKAFDFRSQLGVVDNVDRRGTFCLSIFNDSLAEGSAVIFILVHQPQRLEKATILKKVNQACTDSLPEPNSSFYLLRPDRGEAVFPDSTNLLPASIAIVGFNKPVLKGRRVVSVDLDQDGRPEFFRTCTSNEGVHLTVWSGTPLQGRRRWHAYYYLGYDTMPTCKAKDYK
jgi:hypothetical protein